VPPPRLSTFLVTNARRKVTSSAKRKLRPPPGGFAPASGGAAPSAAAAAAAQAAAAAAAAQTPEGSFYDLLRNGAELLRRCGVAAPEVGDLPTHLAAGPAFLFLHHPALGPAWSIIAQKLRGGSLAEGSELVAEVAEAALARLTLDGSLLITADAPLGHWAPPPASEAGDDESADVCDAAAGDGACEEGGGASASGGGGGGDDGVGGDGGGGGRGRGGAAGGRLVYSAACGRVLLEDVIVTNAGVDWGAEGNCYWQHRVARREAARITLRGRAEFEARRVALRGDLRFDVPDGHRMIVTPAAEEGDGGGAGSAAAAGGASSSVVGAGAGALRVRLERLAPEAPPSWEWAYALDPTSGAIALTMRRGGEACAWPPPPPPPPAGPP